METLARMETDGTLDQHKKKERLMRSREKEKLERTLTGISKMAKIPGALFVVDVRREHIAIKEARKLNIPIIAIVDTNCDPDPVQYPVPANDDAIKSIQIITSVIADAILEGKSARDVEQSSKKAEAEKRSVDSKSKKS